MSRPDSSERPPLGAPPLGAPPLGMATPARAVSTREVGIAAAGAAASSAAGTGAAAIRAAAAPAPRPLAADADRFRQRVRHSFGRHAAGYEDQARLQQATAWRLGHLCRLLPLPAGPRADLGAGTGLLSRALLLHQPPGQRQPLLQLDLCPELLARNPFVAAQPPSPAGGPGQRGLAAAERQTGNGLVWDLNTGLPDHLQGAALLASSFSLQWLEDPAAMLGLWCRSLGRGGWLVLAVPTSGSFPQWHHAAARADVPCTALPLPEAETLLEVVQRQGLELRHGRRLRFSRPGQGGLPTLQHLQRLGASTSRRPPLSTVPLRRLLRHWPADSPLTWELLLLLARRPA